MSKTENEAMVSFDPPLAYPDYRSSVLRAPSLLPLVLEPGRAERSGPVFGDSAVDPLEHDLTRQADRAPIGERIVVEGRVADRDGKPVAGTLVEVWQANAAGRYGHPSDVHSAPLDPGFVGAGRCLTDRDGKYRFVTIKPGAYPWANHHNAWRPAHIHFSLFGRAFTQRLITQMYFPGDPLMDHDPIFQSVPLAGRPLLVAAFDLDVTRPDWALGFRWDIVLGGHTSTPMES
jgi:protocatechuate 3,4-dioxygenase, beta subunit